MNFEKRGFNVRPHYKIYVSPYIAAFIRSDGKDFDNDDGDDDNGDKQNAKEAPSPGELTERRDVRGISNDVYKGRSVKCDEYGIQDIELQIGKMRDEPREPDSPD